MSLAAIDSEYLTLQVGLVEHFAAGGMLAVIKAPPGSGKTHTLIEVLSELAAGGMRIAVAAQTNSQADDVCHRWVSSHPEIRVTRFASQGLAPAPDFPREVSWVSATSELPTAAGITVATTAKWSLTNVTDPFDLLAIDEAWQMGWADLMQCALISGRFLMIGDPGQIPPVVAVDVRRWETSPRAPHLPAPDVVLAEPSLAGVCFRGSLPACRRLPHESVPFVRPFYDFDFHAYVPPGARAVRMAAAWAEPLALGVPVALTLPTPVAGPPVEVDHLVAAAASDVVAQLLDGAELRMGVQRRQVRPADIGVTSSHRIMNAALSAALGVVANEVRVDTPERWQGLERPVMIAVHPLSGVTEPSSFDLETGRLCVMASRHTAGLILLTRDHVGETLRSFVPSAGQAPGRPDVVGRGHDAHLRFWDALAAAGSLRPWLDTMG